jgi:hypothetical protein
MFEGNALKAGSEMAPAILSLVGGLSGGSAGAE